MNFLWKKETTGGVLKTYVDIFSILQKAQQHEAPKPYFPVYRKKKGTGKSIYFRRKGHEAHKRQNWLLAIKFFNRSLCYAERGTIHIGMAYAYRSKMFSKLKMYDKELIDIELAENSIGNAKWLPNELKKNKKICLKRCGQSKKIGQHKLNFSGSAKFPEMSKVINIQQNQEFGRYLVAKEDICIGKTILIEDFFTFVPTSVNKSLCSICFQQKTNLIPCDTCADVMFCNDNCKYQNQIHKIVCSSSYGCLSDTLRVNIHSILIGITAFATIDDLIEFVEENKSHDAPVFETTDVKSKYRFYLNLKPSTEINGYTQISYEAFQFLMTIPKICQLFRSWRKQRFLMHLTIYHTLINALNIFEADKYTMLCLLTSFFNHSCAPNVGTFHVDDKNQMICRTIRSIKKGEQLFISYVPADIGVDNRPIIKKTWGFDCRCDRCEQNVRVSDVEKLLLDPQYQRILQLDHSAVFLDAQQRSRLKAACEKCLVDYACLTWSKEIESIAKIYEKCWNYDIIP